MSSSNSSRPVQEAKLNRLQADEWLYNVCSAYPDVSIFCNSSIATRQMKGLTTNFLLLLQVTLTVAQKKGPESCPAVKKNKPISPLAKNAPIIVKVRVKDTVYPAGISQPAEVEILCVMKGSESLSPTIKVTIYKLCRDGSVFVEKNNTYILLLENDYTKPAIAISV